MPGRAPITRINTGGGFGGFTPNPSIPYPGGRVLASDVEDAANALNFGGVPTPPRSGPTPGLSPTPTPRPAPTVTPTVTDTDLGNFSVSRSLFADDSYNNRTYSPGREYPGDYGFTEPRSSAGIDPGAGFAPPLREGTGRPPPLITDPNDDWIGDPNAPRVAVANPDGLPNNPGGMDDEPIIGRTPENSPAGGPTVELFNGVRGDRGVQYWNTPVNRAPSEMPWWVAFNPNIGQNLNYAFTGPGFGENYDPGKIAGGPKPPLAPGEAWVDLNDYAGSNAVPPPDRTDPGFVDPGTGSEPPPGSTETAGATNRGNNPTRSNVSTPGGRMDQTDRFSKDSGTGNFTADKTTEAFVAAGGYAGAPNRWSPDSRDTFARGTVGILDPETGILRGATASTVAGFQMSQKAGAPALRVGDPASAAAYNAWLMQQPEYKAWLRRMIAGKPTG